MKNLIFGTRTFPWASAPAYLVRDNDHAGDRGEIGRSRMTRYSGDRMLIFGESHLRQILSSYPAYYNGVRTHLALGKDAPLGRAVQRTGVIVAIPIFSGLHHQYIRI